MAGMRMSMRKIREVLRLTHELGLTVRQVREATGVGKTAVCEYVRRAKVVGMTWPIPPEIGDAELERLLFRRLRVQHSPPDWQRECRDRWRDAPGGCSSTRAHLSALHP